MSDALNHDLVEMLRATRRAERDVFGGLDTDVRDRPLREGDWSPKDHQAHLTAWKARQANRFQAVRSGEELEPITDGDETDAINAELQAARADWDWQSIEREADEVSERLEAQILATDADLLRASERLVTGTFGNGAFHAMTHFLWLMQAEIGADRGRIEAFVNEVSDMTEGSSLTERDRGTAIYNNACYYALAGDLDSARSLLVRAFRLRPDLVEFAPQDTDLTALWPELEALAASTQ